MDTKRTAEPHDGNPLALLDEMPLPETVEASCSAEAQDRYERDGFPDPPVLNG